MTKLAILFATACGAGYSPVAPGTAGSLVAIVIAYLLRDTLAPWHFAILAAVTFGPAVWAADVTAKSLKRKDPGLVVIDEVIGQWLALAGARTISWQTCLAAFLLFRLFDI